MVGIPTYTRMGCTGSVVYPDDNHEKLKQANGVKISIKNGNANHLKGDYSQLQLAKHNRDKYVKQRQGRIFAAANEMSGRIMEEREMLSLGTRSRGTSRDTSRAASPTGAKKSHHVKDEIPGQMTPVAEDLHSRDSRRVDHINHDVDEDELLRVHKKSKSHKHKSSNKAKKKHKPPNTTSKPKDKSKRHKKSGKKTTKVGKDGEDTFGENVDSGLEDNHEESSDEENAEKVLSDETNIEKDGKVHGGKDGKRHSAKGHSEKGGKGHSERGNSEKVVKGHSEKGHGKKDVKGHIEKGQSEDGGIGRTDKGQSENLLDAKVASSGSKDDNEVTSATDVEVYASGRVGNGIADVTAESSN